MARPDFPRTIMEFQERFATEEACLEYPAASRWPQGFVCPGCGGGEAWVLARRHLWECAECRLQTSVTAGTVMHGTRTPLRTWFWAAYLVATHHPGIHDHLALKTVQLSACAGKRLVACIDPDVRSRTA